MFYDRVMIVTVAQDAYKAKQPTKPPPTGRGQAMGPNAAGFNPADLNLNAHDVPYRGTHLRMISYAFGQHDYARNCLNMTR